MIRLAPTSTLFPYTTLFRSQRRLARGDHLGVEDLGVLEILHQRTPGDGQSAGIQQIPHLAQHGQQSAGSVQVLQDRKSTRLNSSHVAISYAVFGLKNKTIAEW